MKLLLINSVCGIRSTGRIVTDIAEEYISKGYECRIAFGRENVPSKYENISYRIGSEVNVKVNALKARIFDNEGFNAKGETKKFIKWANDYNPDVLWLHNLHGYYINIDLLFNWIKSRPHMEVRWTLHDCWAFTGHCAHFDFVKCDRWKSQCFSCPQKKEYPTSVIADCSKRNFERKQEAFCGVKNMTLITPSHWLAELAENSFLNEYIIEVVHNKIDKKVFKPTYGDFRSLFNLQNRKIVLGVSSVWNPKKGFDDFIKLAEMLPDPYTVVMVGLSSRQLQSLPSNIVGIERTNSVSQLAEIYTAADVFVNLTYEDNYPTVNLESQACQTPCLTYRTGGSVESVPPEFVVEQGDLTAMISKIRNICLE